MIVLEPLTPDFEDEITRWNNLYPLSSRKPNTRYIGEIYRSDLGRRRARGARAAEHPLRRAGDTPNAFYAGEHLAFTFLSDFTYNRVGLRGRRPRRPRGARHSASVITLSADEREKLESAHALQEEHGISDLVLGLDHMATRILSGDREDALLEYLTMVPYYFWGAYNIMEMNSSTNVTRHPDVDDDKKSPARVFTANNTPSYRELVRQPADADRGLRAQLRPAHAPHGGRRDRRAHRRGEERRLRRAPALRDGHEVPRARRRRVQGRPQPQADLLEELGSTRC